MPAWRWEVTLATGVVLGEEAGIPFQDLTPAIVEVRCLPQRAGLRPFRLRTEGRPFRLVRRHTLRIGGPSRGPIQILGPWEGPYTYAWEDGRVRISPSFDLNE